MNASKLLSKFVLSALLFFISMPQASSAIGEEYPYTNVPVSYSGPVINTRHAIYLPPNHHLYKEGLHEWTNMVKERSKGKIDVKEYIGGVLFKAPAAFKAIRDNICDVTPGYANYAPTGFNLVFGHGLPFLWNDNITAARSLEELYAKYFKKEFERMGCKLGAMIPTSNYHFFSIKPIRKLEDLKGLKVRSGGGLIDKTVLQLGMVPVSVASPEIYSTLQRGVVDCTILAYSSARDYKLYEVSKYVIEVGPGMNLFLASTIVNPAWLAKLPDDLRKVAYGAFRECAFNGSYSYIRAAEDTRKVFRDHGAEIITLGDEELARWKKAVQPVREAWVEEMRGKGLPGKELISDMEALNEKYRKLSPQSILTLQKSNPVSMNEIW